MHIPTDYIEFPHWVKEQTERFWASGNRDCPTWAVNAKWQELSDAEINKIEREFGFSFFPEHRAFLNVLHAIDKQEVIEYTESFETDATILRQHCSFIQNWTTNQEEIRHWITYPQQMLQTMILKEGQWFQVWGKKPKEASQQKAFLERWLNEAPPLIPVHNNCFIVELDNARPILWIGNDESAVVAADLRHWLLKLLKPHLELEEWNWDEYSQVDSLESIAALQQELDAYESLSKRIHVPYWSDLDLTSNQRD